MSGLSGDSRGSHLYVPGDASDLVTKNNITFNNYYNITFNNDDDNDNNNSNNVFSSVCQPKLTHCPECRLSYLRAPRRHRFAEKNAEDLQKLRQELTQIT